MIALREKSRSQRSLAQNRVHHLAMGECPREVVHRRTEVPAHLACVNDSLCRRLSRERQRKASLEKARRLAVVEHDDFAMFTNADT